MRLAEGLSELASEGDWHGVLKGFWLAAPHIQTSLQKDSLPNESLVLLALKLNIRSCWL